MSAPEINTRIFHARLVKGDFGVVLRKSERTAVFRLISQKERMVANWPSVRSLHANSLRQLPLSFVLFR